MNLQKYLQKTSISENVYETVIKLRIEGVGGRAVKLGKFMNYDKIFEEDDLVAKQLLEKVQKL